MRDRPRRVAIDRFSTLGCLVLLASLAAVGCTGTIEDPSGTPGAGPRGATGGTGSTAISTGGSPAGSPGGASGGGGAPVVPSGGGGDHGSGGPPAPAAYADIPCNVASILHTSCGVCHGEIPSFGAPMSLVRAADFSRRAKDGSQAVGQAVIARINDNNRPMPQPPNPRLTPTEASTLTTWIQGGAKPTSCASVPMGSGGDPNGGAWADPTGPGVTCYDVAARTSSGGKFSVAATPDLYHCFSYAPPWGSQKVHLIAWKPIIDNKQVLHHWLLYNETSAVTDKTDRDCGGAHPAAQLVAGWAPGGGAETLPADVGQDVSGAGFTLETHYNNTGAGPVPDASGVRVCVTTNLRANEAGVHWLGTELIFLPAGGTAFGTCAPRASGPITILSSTPHMHLQGRHMTTIINRANGMKETLIDKAFDFQTQVGYPTPTTIMPGDTLTTTCTYGGAALFGEGTKQEMCYNFVLAYPNGALSSGSALRKNGCTGL